MHLPTRFLVLGLLVALLALCSTSMHVSADGSIRPYSDSSCSHPISNSTTNISLVSSPGTCQHTRDSTGTPVAFLYSCNATSFSLTLWRNDTYCLSAVQPVFHVESSDVQQYCSVTQYEDANNLLLFYARIRCATVWQGQDEQQRREEEGKGRTETEAAALTLRPFLEMKHSIIKQTQTTLDVLQSDWEEPPTKPLKVRRQ